MHVTAYMKKSEDNLGEPILSFYRVGPGFWIQVISLGGMHLFPLSPYPAV